MLSQQSEGSNPGHVEVSWAQNLNSGVSDQQSVGSSRGCDICVLKQDT